MHDHLTHSAAVAIAERHVALGLHVTTYVTLHETLLLIDLRSEPLVADAYAGAVVEYDNQYREPVTSLYGPFWDAEAVWTAEADARQDAAKAAFEL